MEKETSVQELDGKEVFNNTSAVSVEMIRYTAGLFTIHRHIDVGPHDGILTFGESCLYDIESVTQERSFGFANIPLYRNRETGNWHVERVLLVPKGFEKIELRFRLEGYDPRQLRALCLWAIIGESPNAYQALHPVPNSENGDDSGIILSSQNNFTLTISRQQIDEVRELRSRSQRGEHEDSYEQGDSELSYAGEIRIVVGEIYISPGMLYRLPNTVVTGRMVPAQSLNRGINIDTLQAVRFRVLEMGRGKILDVMTSQYMLMRGIRKDSFEINPVSVCNNCGHTEDYTEGKSTEHLHCRGCNKIANFTVQKLVSL